jgi:hypothetical protein
MIKNHESRKENIVSVFLYSNDSVGDDGLIVTLTTAFLR